MKTRRRLIIIDTRGSNRREPPLPDNRRQQRLSSSYGVASQLSIKPHCPATNHPMPAFSLRVNHTPCYCCLPLDVRSVFQWASLHLSISLLSSLSLSLSLFDNYPCWIPFGFFFLFLSLSFRLLLVLNWYSGMIVKLQHSCYYNTHSASGPFPFRICPPFPPFLYIFLYCTDFVGYCVCEQYAAFRFTTVIVPIIFFSSAPSSSLPPPPLLLLYST